MLKKSFAVFVFCLGVGVFFLVSGKQWDSSIANSDKPTDRALFSRLIVDKPQGKADSDAIAINSINRQMQSPKSDGIAGRYDEPVEDQLPGLKQAEVDATVGDGSVTVALWEPQVKENSEPEFDASVVYEEEIQTDSEAFAGLQVGQIVEFFVPQLGESFLSEIDSTSNQLGNVKVWKGKIQDGEDKSNFIMTQGVTMTHVVLATSKGVYTAYIDNESGEGAIVDDKEYTGHLANTDDSVPFHHKSSPK